ncbi:MAPEG family protein [Methylopila musalis]|uniref:MAPEG family protein n=1 Tax=Methylopila musalis TaxID=1134781 RepID=A0ABW3Z2Q9_9HYPH
MSVAAILSPVFALVALAFGLLVWMGVARWGAVRAGEVRSTGGSTRAIQWPKRAQAVSDAFHNQLELPQLFYLLVVLALITRAADLVFVLLSWLFVASRYAHAVVHTGSNEVRLRFPLFLAGVVILAVLWLTFALRVLLLSA